VSDIEPGWYTDPADTTIQRYWDGEGWLGEPLPADATPPAGPPADATPVVPARQPTPAARATVPEERTMPPLGRPASGPPGPTGPPPPGWPPNVPFPPPVWSTGPDGSVLVPMPVDIRPHGYALAPLGNRFLARLIDLVIIAVISVAAEFLLVREWLDQTKQTRAAAFQFISTGDNKALQNVPASGSSTLSTLQLVILLVLMAVWAAYEVPFIANGGQTPGKRLMGIRVIPLEGVHPIGGLRAFRRWTTLGLPVLLWTCCGLGLLFQLFASLSPTWNQPLHLAMHDRAAGTIVVAVPRDNPETPDGGTP
jgi:uncharacterized RDD family membrane protein YckC